ncbi:MAG: FG-GAP repeat domain-containing protein, partial [Bacteroidales bacterium]
DFNGDGKDDIVEMYKTGTTQKNIDVFYSKGDGSTVKEVNAYPNVPIDEQYYSVVDYNSDGQADIWRYDYVTSNSTYPIVSYFHSKEKRDLISGVRDGFGAKTLFTYQSLNFRSYDVYSGFWSYLLTKGTNETFPFHDYSGPLKVVSQFYTSNSIGTLNKTVCNYEGAKRHRQGKGFLGFIKTVEASADNKIRTTTSNILRYDYALIRPATIVNTSETDEISASSMMRLQALNSYDLTINSFAYFDTLINYGNKRIFIAPRYAGVYDAQKGSFRAIDSRFDNFGNQIFSRTKYSYSNGSPVQATFVETMGYEKYNNPEIKNRLISNISTKEYTGKPKYIRKSTFEYDTKGNLTKKTDDPSTVGEIATTFFNNLAGLPDSVRISATGVQSSTTGYIYDGLKRFVIKEINPIGKVTRKAFNQVTGNIDTLIDVGNLKTILTYDGFGRTIKIKSPDNIETTTLFEWTTDGYKISESRPGTPLTYSKFNILGREVESMTEGQFANSIVKKIHNAAGQLIRDTPYGDGVWVNYSYDYIGRLDTITYNGNIKTFIVYDGSMPEVHNPDGTTKKTTKNAMGDPILVKENNQDAVVYTYHSSGQPQTITTYGTQFS